MEDSQLRELAASMGMKKTENADKQDLAYYVIDNTSIQTARDEVAKMKPKRGRKPGKKASDVSADGDAAADGEAPAPKKRGRKPKVQAEAEAAGANNAAAEATAPKKRGRKPKTQVEAEATKGAEDIQAQQDQQGACVSGCA